MKETAKNATNNVEECLNTENITVLENDTINIKARDHSEAIRTAVLQSTPVLKKDGMPIGVGKKNKNHMTAKMQAFTTYVLQGDSPLEACKKAYQWKGTDASARVHANKLMHDARVSHLLEQGWSNVKEAVVADQVQLKRHVLDQLYQHANEEKNPLSLRIRSLELLGRSIGMFTDKVETKTEQVNTDQLKKELESHLSMLDATKH